MMYSKSLRMHNQGEHHELRKTAAAGATSQSEPLLESLRFECFECFSFFAFFSFLCLLFFSFLCFFLSLDCRQWGSWQWGAA